MNKADRDRYIKLGMRCECGKRAVTYFATIPSCQDCIDKDSAIYGAERIRSTCGFTERLSPGAMYQSAEA